MFKIFNSNQKRNLVKSHGLDLVLIIDRSGSMEGMENNIIAGHQRLVNGLKKAGKNITLTTILFDEDIVIACDGKHPDNIKKLDYRPDGSTALYDAWGAAIIHENKRKKSADNPYPNADVLYLTVTDGMENDSKIFNLEKIKEMMMQERRRSIEGRGVREFATINEFGIDSVKMEKDLKIGKNNSQIFYRGDEGIAVLFKIIELATENMIEYRRITEKWITKSDKLKIGSYTLGQIKQMTKKPERVLANVEKVYMDLLLAADEGLTDKFWAMYDKYCGLIRKLEESDSLKTNDEEVDAILRQYVFKNYNNQKFALRYAKDATVNKVAARCAVHLGKIRELADMKEVSAKEFLRAATSFKETLKRLEYLPSYITELKSARIADNISNIVFDEEKRYKEIIEYAFKMRINFLKDALGTKDSKTLLILEKYTKEPVKTHFGSLPVYIEFCNWYEIVKNEINSSDEYQVIPVCSS